MGERIEIRTLTDGGQQPGEVAAAVAAQGLTPTPSVHLGFPSIQFGNAGIGLLALIVVGFLLANGLP